MPLLGSRYHPSAWHRAWHTGVDVGALDSLVGQCFLFPTPVPDLGSPLSHQPIPPMPSSPREQKGSRFPGPLLLPMWLRLQAIDLEQQDEQTGGLST